MAMSIQEAFNVLGLTRDASPDEVKKAYRTLALQFHPDKNPDPAATATFQQLSAAYKRVDDYLKRGPNADNQTFEDFFGGAAEFGDFDEEGFDFDDLGVPSMEEMLFMFDMLFGSPPQATRRSGGPARRKKGKKSGEGGVRVNFRRKGGRQRDPPGFPSYIDREFMDMFAHGMTFDDPDLELSDLEGEFMSMASFFASSGMPFDSAVPSWISKEEKKQKTQVKKGPFQRSEVEASQNQRAQFAKKTPTPAPTIGSKVCIHGKHSGVVMFTGHVHYAKGEFVGVALSSPQGKNDGSIKGVRYFECSPSHGLMVRPSDVTLAA
ncbi:hypothetical protein PHYPSEUDO_011727 [Phytophthora pseudosyringae]|uniref:J domain-containing protein n=1 Tax=Phytophthora pseudosyringae TaxID=221518 RepID=A0A8T1VBC5_9STRA|nr:hypothetical protein PHYPSEUDO_011727 [Phytophthora pseudosyringae]